MCFGAEYVKVDGAEVFSFKSALEQMIDSTAVNNFIENYRKKLKEFNVFQTHFRGYF